MSDAAGGAPAPAFVAREASAADLDAVERLIAAFQAESDWRRDPPMHAATRAAITAGRAAGARVFVAESVDERASAADAAARRNAPVGFASTWFAWDLGDGPGTWLSDLYVVPAWRRRAVGRALVSAVARAARADGAVWIAWHVDHTNPNAQEFYVALGAVRKPTHLLMSLDAAAIDRLGG